MKAMELRIGNYIENTDSQMASYMVVNADVIKQNEHTMYASLQPISLTEEWLLKFGFEINRQTKEENNIWRCYSQEGFFEVEQIGSSFFLDDNHCYGTKINHVHQLQNLYFALMGGELTLKP